MTHLMSRRVLIAAVAACGAGLLAACGSSAAPSARPSTTVTTVTATAKARASAPPSSGGSGSRSSSSAPPPAGPAACATSQLQLNLGGSNGTAGSIVYPVQFTNISRSACTLYGYPGVSLVTAVNGSQIGAPAAEDSSTARRVVTLAPDAKANALLNVVVAQNYPAGKCKLTTARWMRVYPPGQTAPLYLRHTFQTCAATSVRTLSVQTVRAGSGNP